MHASVEGELPLEASRSVEVDVAGMGGDPEGRMADLIDGSIGEASMFWIAANPGFWKPKPMMAGAGKPAAPKP